MTLWDKQLLNFVMCISEEEAPFIEPDVYLDDSSTLGKYCWIRRGSIVRSVRCLNDVFIGFRSELYNTEINSGCAIASRTKIGSPLGSTVFIGSNVWIGAKATIEQGITIGDGAVIGAGAYVCDDVQPFSVVVGRPAKRIRTRTSSKNNHDKQEFRSLLATKRDYCKTSDGLTLTLLESMRKYSDKISSTYMQTIRKRNNLPAEYGSDNFIDANLHLGTGVKFGNSIIAIGKSISDRNGNLLVNGGIALGDEVSIGSGTILEGGGQINVGQKTKIGRRVLILSTSHNMNASSMPMTLEPVHIGADVEIGDESLILGGVTIKDGTVIPPGSLLTKKVFFDCNFNELYRERIT